MKSPDPVMHFVISIIKSAIRIAAGIALIKGMLAPAGLLFILAEILGIAEEIV